MRRVLLALCACAAVAAVSGAPCKPRLPALGAHKDTLPSIKFGKNMHVEPVVMKGRNGADMPFETAYLTIGPGDGFAPHKHLDGDEVIYFLSGVIEYGWWLEGEAGPTIRTVAAGNNTWLPKGAIHKVWNNGPEPADMIVVLNSVSRMEFYEDWPASFDAKGVIPEAMPWDDCGDEKEEL